MIPRQARSLVEAALGRQAAVALVGPRQVGKTTLALEIAQGRPAIYLDLEAASDREKLSDPVLFLGQHADKLVILDEIHRIPALFEALRGIVDTGRRAGHRTGRFLILGSAAIDLLRQSSETLAGRIEYVDLAPLCATEVDDPRDVQRLWVRGGFPDSFLAATDADSLHLRRSFIRTYLERDVPMFGPRIPAETLERLWAMLAHSQGTLLNASRLASGLGVSAPTVTGYIGLLIDLLLELGGQHGTWAVEIKRGLAPKAEKGFHIALGDLKPAKAFLVYSGTDRYPKGGGIEAIGLRELAEELRALG